MGCESNPGLDADSQRGQGRGLAHNGGICGYLPVDAYLSPGKSRRSDAAGMGAYVESSNPKNATFYERGGFVAPKNIAPDGAPPLIAMWRDAKLK